MPPDTAQFTQVEQWVDYIQTLHAREIDLGLERVKEVFRALIPTNQTQPYEHSNSVDQPLRLSCGMIVIAGTNGKGSTSALLSSIYQHAGYRTGKYTSPHLNRFNERIEIDGSPISDALLISCMQQVEAARGDVPLTFFEFGTLAAMLAFERSEVELAIMEIGLGGRLDAVNILEHDLAIITNVSIDHTAWLGDTRAAIGHEKAGVARAQRPLVLAANDMPDSVLVHAAELGAVVYECGTAYQYHHSETAKKTWSFSNGEVNYDQLPLPFAQAGVQLANAAAAIQACCLLQTEFEVPEVNLRLGIGKAKIAGRCQIIGTQPLKIIDVSHNQASLKRLAEFIAELKNEQHLKGRCIAICGMLKDKQIAKSMAEMADLVDRWNLVSIHNERGASAALVATAVKQVSSAPLRCYDDIQLCYQQVRSALQKDDCLVVFGSFHIAGDILAALEEIGP